MPFNQEFRQCSLNLHNNKVIFDVGIYDLGKEHLLNLVIIVQLPTVVQC